jgi:hypothetical protein
MLLLPNPEGTYIEEATCNLVSDEANVVLLNSVNVAINTYACY